MENTDAYARKRTLMTAGLKQPRYEVVSIRDAQPETFVCFNWPKGIKGFTPIEVRDYAAETQAKDGTIYSFYFRKAGAADYTASASVLLRPGDDVATIGLTVNPDQRGSGVGTDIFRLLREGLARKAGPLGIRAIEAEVLQSPPNPASERALEKAGYTRTGIAPTRYGLNVNGAVMDITGKDVMHFRYELKREQTRAR